MPLLSLALAAGLLVLLALGVVSGASDALDRAVIDLVRDEALSAILSPLRPITELGSTWAVTLVGIAALGVGVLRRVPRLGAVAAITILLASAGTSVLKLGFARTRPELLEPILEERGFSFPSGHALLSTVAFGVLAVVLTRTGLTTRARRAIVAAAAVVIALVGLSRVWLGVHYPTDVLAGWLVGSMVVVAFAAISRAALRAPAAAGADAGRAAPRSDPPGSG